MYLPLCIPEPGGTYAARRKRPAELPPYASLLAAAKEAEDRELEAFRLRIELIKSGHGMTNLIEKL